jgi:hypothetical protein
MRTERDAVRHIRNLMIGRCADSEGPKWHRYGGRGIRVCQRWLGSLESFIADMGPRPSPKHSIDRKDNDAHYSCGKCDECKFNGWSANCRWATQQEQQSNKSSNVLVTVNGESHTITEWARRCGISAGQVSRRIARGWSPERACSTPITRLGELARAARPAGGKRLLTLNGETLPLAAWARRAGMDSKRLKARLDRYGWSVERAVTTPVGPTGRIPKHLRPEEKQT